MGSSTEAAYLECDHCGNEAIDSPDGLFADGEGSACQMCEFPGHVSIDDSIADEDARAYWWCSDDAAAVCNDPLCSDCLFVRNGAA